MSFAHLHLLSNHLPIIGSFIGLLVLIFALWKKSEETKIAAFGIFILCAIGAGIAYLTGEEIEHLLNKNIVVSKDLIHAHEDFSLFALISLIILGIVSIYGIYTIIKKTANSKLIEKIILGIALVSWVLISKTGYLGGQIRHTELDPNTPKLEQGVDEARH